MRRRWPILLCAALAALGSLPAQAQTISVTIGSRLEPAHLEVSAGSSVTWHNTDGERHRVRSTSAPQRLDSGNLEAGETWEYVFQTPGTYHYLDAREDDDPAYHGTVVVTTNGSSTGGSSSGDEAGSNGSSGTAGTAGGSSVSAEVVLVERSFSPASIEVPTGTTVSWSNSSDRDHNVTAEDGSFASGELAEGGRFSHTFSREGAFGYFCTLHSGMRGTVVVGGGGDGADQSSDGEGAPRSGSAPEAPGTTADDQDLPSQRQPEARTITVDAQDFAFSPQDVSVTAGDTVEWVNVGEAPHTVTGEGAAFDSGTIDAGGRFRHRFDETGTYDYVCAFHPQMVGRIEVSEAGDGGSGEEGAEIVSPNADVLSVPGPPGDAPPDGGDVSPGTDPDGDEPAPLTAAAASPSTDGRTPVVLVLVLAAIAVLVPLSVLLGASRVAHALRAVPERD